MDDCACGLLGGIGPEIRVFLGRRNLGPRIYLGYFSFNVAISAAALSIKHWHPERSLSTPVGKYPDPPSATMGFYKPNYA